MDALNVLRKTNLSHSVNGPLLPLPYCPGVWHHSPSSPQEANRKHGQRIHSGEAERTAELSGLNYPAPSTVNLTDGQEVPGPQQLLCQLHR